jgi:DNA invertase Pin-like site-specific DNA recombinase
MNNNIINIAYLRVSTFNTSQLSSLGTQFKLLKNTIQDDTNFVTYSGSGGNEFPPELKNKIIELYNGKNPIQINVVQFDRLTRNIKDLDFLIKYVQYIHIIDENKTYNVITDIKIIHSQISKCVQELDMIRSRRIREYRDKKKTENDYVYDDKVYNIRKRCRCTFNNMSECDISSKNMKKLQEFIRISQQLNSKSKWEEMYALMMWFGLDVDKIRNDYKRYTDKYPNKNSKSNNIKITDTDNLFYVITRADLINFVTDILEKNKFHKNDIFIKHFINSNIKYCRLLQKEE